MKKFALKSFALVLFVSTFLSSCSSDEEGETLILQNEYVTDVTGPTTGTINQEITFTVSYTVDNSCGDFSKYIETVNGTTKTIEVQAKYIGSDCNANPVVKTQPYTFTIIQPNTYTFRFKKSTTEIITKTIVIE